MKRGVHAVDAARLRAQLGARAVVVVALDDDRRVSAVSDAATLGDADALTRWARTLVLLPSRPLLHGEQLTAGKVLGADGEPAPFVTIAIADLRIDLEPPRSGFIHSGRHAVSYPTPTTGLPQWFTIGGPPVDRLLAARFREACFASDRAPTHIRLTLERPPK